MTHVYIDPCIYGNLTENGGSTTNHRDRTIVAWIMLETLGHHLEKNKTGSPVGTTYKSRLWCGNLGKGICTNKNESRADINHIPRMPENQKEKDRKPLGKMAKQATRRDVQCSFPFSPLTGLIFTTAFPFLFLFLD